MRRGAPGLLRHQQIDALGDHRKDDGYADGRDLHVVLPSRHHCYIRAQKVDQPGGIASPRRGVQGGGSMNRGIFGLVLALLSSSASSQQGLHDWIALLDGDYGYSALTLNDS